MNTAEVKVSNDKLIVQTKWGLVWKLLILVLIGVCVLFVSYQGYEPGSRITFIKIGYFIFIFLLFVALFIRIRTEFQLNDKKVVYKYSIFGFSKARVFPFSKVKIHKVIKTGNGFSLGGVSIYLEFSENKYKIADITTGNSNKIISNIVKYTAISYKEPLMGWQRNL